jgi:hypothetical protein
MPRSFSSIRIENDLRCEKNYAKKTKHLLKHSDIERMLIGTCVCIEGKLNFGESVDKLETDFGGL